MIVWRALRYEKAAFYTLNLTNPHTRIYECYSFVAEALIRQRVSTGISCCSDPNSA